LIRQNEDNNEIIQEELHMSGNEKPRSGREQSFQERRRKADWIVKMATILSLIAWAVAVAVWVVLDRASPEKEVEWFTSIARKRGTDIVIRDYWDSTLLPLAFGLLIAALAICVLAFFFNKLRMRRKTDKYRKSIIIIGIITIFGLALFLFRFGLPGASVSNNTEGTPQAYVEQRALQEANSC